MNEYLQRTELYLISICEQIQVKTWNQISIIIWNEIQNFN